MKFEEIEGSQTVTVSTETLTEVEQDINRELNKEDSKSIERARLAEIAIAVGIKTGRKEESDSSTTAVKMESLDKDNTLKVLIERINPEMDASDLRKLLSKYLEGGMREIAENIEENSSFQYTDYIPDEYLP